MTNALVFEIKLIGIKAERDFRPGPGLPTVPDTGQRVFERANRETILFRAPAPLYSRPIDSRPDLSFRVCFAPEIPGGARTSAPRYSRGEISSLNANAPFRVPLTHARSVSVSYSPTISSSTGFPPFSFPPKPNAVPRRQYNGSFRFFPAARVRLPVTPSTVPRYGADKFISDDFLFMYILRAILFLAARTTGTPGKDDLFRTAILRDRKRQCTVSESFD